MHKFIVKIYDTGVSEFEIKGFDEAVEFAMSCKGTKAEIISSEGLIVQTVKPGGNVTPSVKPLPHVDLVSLDGKKFDSVEINGFKTFLLA